jgi:hypothetical protein
LLFSILDTSTKKERTKSDNSTKKYFSKVRSVHVGVCCVVGCSRGWHIWIIQKKSHLTSK